jgi:hypothetical protein
MNLLVKATSKLLLCSTLPKTLTMRTANAMFVNEYSRREFSSIGKPSTLYTGYSQKLTSYRIHQIHTCAFINLYCSPSIIRIIESRRIRLAGM